MLNADIAGRAYSKVDHRRRLLPLLHNRSEGAVEYKHQNISAVLVCLGETWIQGYKPAFNFQTLLVEAVARWLAGNQEWMMIKTPAEKVDAKQLLIGPSPTFKNEPPHEELEKILQIACKFDAADRDERNRVLGRAGEELVLKHERTTLLNAGQDHLARKVRWVSDLDGDGAGYDISSYTPNGQPRLIEVKTTNGWDRTPFYISPNELTVASENEANWRLLRVWDFSREPKGFELQVPLERHVSLTSTGFRANFN